MKTMYRQGDVLIERVDALPASAVEIPQHGRIVLALGEVTGHAHAIALDDGPVKARLFDAGTERFLQVLAASILDHEEHAAIALEPGVYRVSKFGTGTQREYTPEAIRNVAD
jgi:hypothetical protein